MTSTLYVDPPDGWRFGFPKAVPKEDEHQLLAWIVDRGYPQHVIDEWKSKHFPLRCWRTDTEGGDNARAALTKGEDGDAVRHHP